MMSKDITKKKLEDYDDVVLDVVNNLLFDGTKVLDENDLEKMPTEEFTKVGNRQRQGNRDVKKAGRKNQRFRLIIGLENQEDVDNTMPERTMGYDYGSYEEQIKEIVEENRKNKCPAFTKRIHSDQKLAPVVTAVLYFGYDWTGPRTLHEMLDFPEEIKERLKELVPDYPLNLIEVRKLSPEARSRLTSDFRLIAEFVACQDKPKELDELLADKKFVIKHPEEFFELLGEITSDRRFRQVKKLLTEEEKNGGVTMCDGLDRIEKRGAEKKEKLMLQLIQCMADNGEGHLIADLARKPGMLQEMYKKYNLA